MIFDRIENLPRYHFKAADQILSFIQQNAPFDFTITEQEIDGRKLYVRPSSYETRLPEEGKLEAHRVYADLQYVVSGVETMQVCLDQPLTAESAYDEKGDYQFFSDGPVVSDVVVPAGYFAVFFPGEAHRPCCHYQAKSKVQKLVFKIRM